MTFNEIKNKIAINYEFGAITDDQLIDLIIDNVKFFKNNF